MEQKPGWKTSEFWVVVLAAILPIADQLLQNAPQNAPWYAVASAIIAAGYAWSRAHAKVGVANAIASTKIAAAQAFFAPSRLATVAAPVVAVDAATQKDTTNDQP